MHRHVILGTAGHIDHGKTSLVKALTGVDADRLPEEKARGMTIDLGFAHMGESATIIDVPGHEKFIKNMVAGVSTIDIVLFVIAADDGIMPQTREHLDICQLLQVQRGIVALTKKDLVEPDWLELLQEDIRQFLKGTFLEDAPIIPVSSITGEGIPELRQAIAAMIANLPPRQDRGVFWMPVDRSFSMKGFGTVVTGSVLSGQLHPGESLEILPSQKQVRVRGLQRHGKEVDRVQIGDRAAINLLGIATEEIGRGDVLAAPGYFHPTRRANCRVQLLPNAPAPLKNRSRVRVHLGTAEIMARVIPIDADEIAPGKTGYVHVLFEQAVATRRLETLVIRRYSPPRTIGGGIVLDSQAAPYRRSNVNLVPKLQALEKEDSLELLVAQFLMPDRYTVTIDQLATEIGGRKEELQQHLQVLVHSQNVLPVGKRGYIHRQRVESLWHQLENLLRDFHVKNPTRLGIRKAELSGLIQPLAEPTLLNFFIEHYKAGGKIKEIDAHIALAEHEIHLPPEQEGLRQKILEILYNQAYAPSSPAELAAKLSVSEKEIEAILSVLQIQKEIVRLEEGIFMHRRRLEQAKKKVVDYLRQNNEITVSQFKELVENTSRKFAVPLLQYLDTMGITERRGEVRVLGVEGENDKPEEERP
ncbi:MAG: selenocysteine-specific translation elongation factor [candidate division KSB1 bacterium]|nr:selenocysteine-specific translation elongation factor [candidate division KSB1 bacterium]MDZ7304173.1 selenocysteine-specific translation elongation factor [candidate division KSB1 bacterium]MDZ7310645.1 selenocysteine-specific translation elongation factor [candidate division KSB1 bacterium]